MSGNAVAFLIVLILALAFFGWSCWRRFGLLRLGKRDVRWNEVGARLRNMVYYAFFQRRVLSRPFGFNHGLLFWGFLVLLIANLEFILAGIFPQHIHLSLLPEGLYITLAWLFDIVSALVFAWEHAKHISVKTYDEKGSRIYELTGPLFFGSVKNFLDLFNPENDPNDVILEFQNSRVADHSAIEAIDNLAEKYIKAGKQLHLRHLSLECRELLKNAGDLVEVNVLEDPKYHVADDQLA